MLGKLRDILGNLPSAATWPVINDQYTLSSQPEPARSDIRDYQFAFIQAAVDGDLDLIKEYLEQDLIDVNTTDFNGATALMHAVRHEQINVVSYLLQSSRADVNLEDNSGHSALCYAIQNRNSLLSTWLLIRDTQEYIKNKALMKAFAQFCQSQLHPDEGMRIQAYGVYEELITLLLRHGANPMLGGIREAAVAYPGIMALLNAASKSQSRVSGLDVLPHDSKVVEVSLA